jgi:hypothetical protein
MDTENVVNIHDGTLVSLEKEGNPAIFNNRDELGIHYATQNKPDMKDIYAKERNTYICKQ